MALLSLPIMSWRENSGILEKVNNGTSFTSNHVLERELGSLREGK